MAITLAEAKVGMADKVVQSVIDEFGRASFLLDKMTFDNSVSPGTGGSTLVYGYTQLLTPSTAAFRALNSEYTANEAKRVEKTVSLKIFGGSFSVDRVIQQTSGTLDEMGFQLSQKIKAAANAFHYTVIQGDATNHTTEFDGLDVMLTGSSTEYTDSKGMNLSSTAAIDSSWKYFVDALDDFISGLEGTPTMLTGNRFLLNKIKAVGKRAGYYTRDEKSFGRPVETYAGIPLIDLGEYYNGANSSTVQVVPVYSAKLKPTDDAAATGLTDLYAITLGLDGFHGVSPTGNKIINTYLPDMKAPGAVKKGEVEMVCACALKNSKKAGVMRGIKVMPDAS